MLPTPYDNMRCVF